MTTTKPSKDGGAGSISVKIVDQSVVDLFGTLDRMDVTTYVNAFTEDGMLRLGNSEPVVGRQQVEQAVSTFLSMIGGLSHEITGVWLGSWGGGDVKSVEAEVTYTRKDGTRTQPLPVTSTLRMEGDRIKDYRVFMETSPLFAEVISEHAATQQLGVIP